MLDLLNLFAGKVFAVPTDVTIAKVDLPFKPPDLTSILSFAIKFLIVVAGLAALLFLLLGAISWITSGGNKENVDKARDKIMNAVIGLILVFVVIAIVVLMENALFTANCGLGISKDICIPSLIQPK